MPNLLKLINYGLLFLTCNRILQNFRWTLSTMSLLPTPHTSQPYNKISLTILSNRLSWHSMDRLCNLPFMIISYVALVVLLTLSFLAFEKLPVLEIKIPRYLNSIELLIYWCFNATFSNISAISWRPVLVVEEAGGLGENHRPMASNW